MRSDQLDETTREASRDHAGSDADLRDLMKHRHDCARDIARAFQSGRGGAEDPLLMRKILATLEDLAAGSQVPDRQPAGRVAPAAEGLFNAIPILHQQRHTAQWDDNAEGRRAAGSGMLEQDDFSSSRRSIFFLEHDPFGKPVFTHRVAA